MRLDRETLCSQLSKRVVVILGILVLYAAVVATPAEVLGCRTRGLMAVTIALGSGLAAIVAMSMGVVERARGAPQSFRWVVGGVLLALPALHLMLYG